MLALLATASHQTLLAAVTVGSLNVGLVSSASAATCVTSVSPTFANVVGDVTGAPGQTVVTSVTPTFNNAVTGVSAPQQPVVTNVAVGTGTVTGITPTPGAPTNLIAPAFAPNFPSPNNNLPPRLPSVFRTYSPLP
jgi:hypothetical protein